MTVDKLIQPHYSYCCLEDKAPRVVSYVMLPFSTIILETTTREKRRFSQEGITPYPLVATCFDLPPSSLFVFCPTRSSRVSDVLPWALLDVGQGQIAGCHSTHRTKTVSKSATNTRHYAGNNPSRCMHQ